MKKYLILSLLFLTCFGRAAESIDVSPAVIQSELRELNFPSERMLNDPRLGVFVASLKQLRSHLNYGSPLARHIDEHLPAIDTAESYYRTHTYSVSGYSVVDFTSHVTALFAGFFTLFPNGYTVADIVKNNTSSSTVDIQAIRSALNRLAIPRRFPTQADLAAFSERLRTLMLLVPENTKLGALIKPEVIKVERAKNNYIGAAFSQQRFVDRMLAFRARLNRVFGGYYDTKKVETMVRLPRNSCQVEMASTAGAGDGTSGQ